MYKPAQTRAPVHPLIASRWSPRAFEEDKTIDANIILSLAEAARWAPSCFGAEPWRFLCGDNNTNSSAWKKAFSCLVEGNQKWAKHAQILILVCAEQAFAHNGKPNRHCAYDSGAAAMNLTLEAEHHGLRCHQMGGFDADAAKKTFAIPDGFECISVIAVGIQADAGRLSDKELRERESVPRQRKPLGECFFDGKWENPIAP